MGNDIPKFEDTEEILDDAPTFDQTLDEQASVQMGGELGIDLPDVIRAEESKKTTSATLPTPQVSQAEAGLLGGQQGLTMGTSDEIGAGVYSGMDWLMRKANELGLTDTKSPTQVSEELAAEGVTGDIGPTSTYEMYQDAVAKERAKLKAAQEQHPYTYTAGELAGGIAMPIPGSGAAKALGTAGKALSKVPGAAKVTQSAGKVLSKVPGKDTVLRAGETVAEGAARVGDEFSKLGKVTKGALTGGGINVAEEYGRSEGDMDLMDALTAFGTGAAFGGGAGYIAKRAGQKAPEAAELARQEGEKAVLRSIGANEKHVQDIIGTATNKRATLEDAHRVGQTLVDEGVFKIKQTPNELKNAIIDKMDDVAENRLNKMAKSLDQQIKNVPRAELNKYGNKMFKSLRKQVDEISKQARYGSDDQKRLAEQFKSRVNLFGEDILEAYNSEDVISKLIKIKRDMQSQINWQMPEQKAYNDFLVQLQSHASDLINDLSHHVSPEIGKKMKKANETYKNLTLANKVAGDDLASSMVNQTGIGWKDYFLGSAAAAITKSPVLGAGIIAGKKLGEKAVGKPTGRIMESAIAKHQFKKADKLAKGETLAQNIDKAVPKAMVGKAAIKEAYDEEKPQQEPYKQHQRVTSIIKKATPEMIIDQASKIRQEYGEKGEQLARILDNLATKDVKGRNALMFQILQTPAYRKMMNIEE